MCGRISLHNVGEILTDTLTTMNDTTFESLGLSKPLLDAVNALGYEHPSQIQVFNLCD